MRCAALMGLLAAVGVFPVYAQSGSGNQQQPAQQQKPASSSQENSNPFPEDEGSVPVMPSGSAADTAADAAEANSPDAAPARDSDPVKSPEDMGPSDNGATTGFSSSLNGLDNVIQPPTTDTTPTGKKGKNGKDDSLLDIMPRETPKEDVDVGNYYMSNKDWKGALSRFQSALVLAPDNPDVYWGLAECERHMGEFAQARANYQKVVEYDPDSKHAKEAKKALKDPELANVKPALQP